ncbi:MAG: DUF721 domain-containing protein [Gammaproteobacteria bacterium]|nr:DUF721 domain-containing protein [Gammaproteobacteria bacterium]
MTKTRYSIPKSVSRILTTSGNGLQPMLERAYFLQALTRNLRDVVEPALAGHISITNLRDNIAVVTADSPAWLSKLRYQAPIILRQLQQLPGLEHIGKVQFKVQPVAEIPPEAHPPRRAKASDIGAQVLASTADGMANNELANALRRLAQQVKKSTTP